MSGAMLLAAAGIFAAEMRTTFQWGRIHGPEDWLLPGGAAALVAAYVWRMYRRDGAELRPWLTWLLLGLRTVVWAGLFLIWLQPQWRNEEDIVTPSRVVVLVDTSLSMAENVGEETAEAQSKSDSSIRPGSRSAAALQFLESPVLAEIRKTHEIHVAGFDAGELRRVTTMEREEVRNAEFGMRNAEKKASGSSALRIPNSELVAALVPRGGETRLGEALNQALYDHRGAPLSGIVLLTDGGQNTGIEPLDALAAATADRIVVPPLFPVGLGSTSAPKNVRIQDVVAPSRTYPSDQFTVTGFVQAQGLAGRTVTVEMNWRTARPGGDDGGSTMPSLDRQTKNVVLPEDGKPVAVEFTLKPTKVGRTTVSLSLANPPADDRNPTDNGLDVDVEVTERRNKILLFAAAATREYQFLRNQLQRLVRTDGSKDKEFVVDVCLQTGSEGVSQDSSEILPDFPDTAELLFDYDCVIAFDPDWRRLSLAQATLLKQWVEEKAGGLIVVAGRLNTDAVARDPNLSTIRALYPVEFGRLIVGGSDPFGGSTEPWRVGLTEEGKKSDFLRLDDADASAYQAWNEFEGFYDYHGVKGVKEKSTVLASLVDPHFKGTPGGRLKDEARPYLMVSQAVGAGRVLYLAGGELWRLRAVNPSYFTRLYTQMVRHVSQARLLRGSKRGVLLVDHDNGRYSLNDVVEVRAQLMDARAKPYSEPSVDLRVLGPDQRLQTVRLERDAQLPGNYRGLFPVRQVGAYRLDLSLPEGDHELPPRRLQVRIPNKESDDVRLNAALLERLAAASGGTYFAGLDAVGGGPNAASLGSAASLVSRLADKTRVTPRLAKPVSLWDNQWTMMILCGLLGLEWLIRRLVRLA
jgi:hypothetical protein